MKKHTPKYLKDYRPPEYWIDKIDLQFDLAEDQTIVTSTMKIRRNSDAADKMTPLVLNCRDVDILSVVADDMVLCTADYELTEETFKLSRVPEQFVLEIKNRLKPQENTSLEGLYKSGGTFCTQCEAEGFRRITCFPDRPDVMSHFSCIITADKSKYPVLLSNGNLVDRGDLDKGTFDRGDLDRRTFDRGDLDRRTFDRGDLDRRTFDRGDLDNGRHYVKWDDPFKKPCYLFALVAGDLTCIEDHFTTCSGRKITLQIFVEHENRDKCGHAMKSLKESMTWDEKRFGREYDLDLYQIFAANDFNMGAMENKGLNIFNSRYVLAKTETATDRDFMNIQQVIAHEYFHNWTGNRITLKNWFQLSLKEGLTVFRDQEFSSDLNSRAVQRISVVKKLRTHQFPEDSGPMAHPVRPESYIEMNNFYTMTVYEKGAEVIRMMFELLGMEMFRKGMDLYFERFDGQAVTTEDFVQTMEDASGMDLSQFRLWYSQSGTPRVTVKREYDSATRTLAVHLKQQTPQDRNQSLKKSFHIPVKCRLISPNGVNLTPSISGSSISTPSTPSPSAPNPSAPPSTISGSNQKMSTDQGFMLNSDQGFMLNSDQDFMLHLKEEEQTFTFKEVPQGTLPSLFRGFSAPVIIENDFSAEELAFLMANDTDEFNQWDAAQQLYFMEFNKIITGLQTRSCKPLISSHLVNAFKQALCNETTDRSLIAQALTLPDESEIGQQYDPVDVDVVHAARHLVKQAIATELAPELQAMIDLCAKAGPKDISHAAMADRSLKNAALSYIGSLDKAQSHDVIFKHYNDAQNMTDEIAALSILCSSTCEDAMIQTALEQFYTKWNKDPLVLDKWFTVQAASTRPGTLDNIKALTRHPDFSWKNPNRVRSVMAVLGTFNPFVFHQADGEGYAFFAKQVIHLDKINSQIAARLAAAFNRWKKYDVHRQKLMKQRLEDIAGASGLSRDVYEIVSKALQI